MPQQDRFIVYIGAIAKRGQWEQGCSLYMATDLGLQPYGHRATRKKMYLNFDCFPLDIQKSPQKLFFDEARWLKLLTQLCCSVIYFFFQLKNVPEKDIYPPSRIKDLTAEISIANVKFWFTAPGDDFDDGTGKLLNKTFSQNTKTLIAYISESHPVMVAQW